MQDSDTEDLIATEVNDYVDSSDEAIEEDADIPESDTEQDLVVFPSNDEDSELEFESDYESEDDEDSEETESDNDSPEETEKNLQIKQKDDKKKSNHDSVVTKSLVSKNKTLRKKEMKPVSSKLKNGQIQNNSQEMQTYKDDKCDKEIKVASDTADKEQNEYSYDSSDEEDIRNTVGNIPMKWYDEYDHVGYNWEGKKILKPEKGDELDNFLQRMENPDFWRTIKDPQTGQDVVLNKEDIDLIVRIQKQKIPDTQFDEFAVSYIYITQFGNWSYIKCPTISVTTLDAHRLDQSKYKVSLSFCKRKILNYQLKKIVE